MDRSNKKGQAEKDGWTILLTVARLQLPTREKGAEGVVRGTWRRRAKIFRSAKAAFRKDIFPIKSVPIGAFSRHLAVVIYDFLLCVQSVRIFIHQANGRQ